MVFNLEKRGKLACKGAVRIDFVLAALGLPAAAMNEHEQIVVSSRCLHARSPL
jgi:hypothetical protein